jgi:hypothetical protein
LLGFIVAFLNGTGHCYVRGKDSSITLNNQSNYICLKAFEGETEPDIECSKIKQRSELLHKLRKKSRISGSTIFNAVGLRTFKDQQAHHEKVFLGKVQEEPEELPRFVEIWH